MSASLCHILRDPGALEYAANQTREEARHVTGFSIYVMKRWGCALPAGRTLSNMLNELVLAPEVYKKDIDRTLIRENLKLTPEQRILQLMKLQAFAEELRAAGRRRRP